MKYGVRKPNIKKSIKARTTGKVKRQVKKAVNPLYGKKGMGIVNDPKKAAYNAVYNRTTVGVSDIAKGLTAANGNPAASSSTNAPQKKGILCKYIQCLWNPHDCSRCCPCTFRIDSIACCSGCRNNCCCGRCRMCRHWSQV